MAAITRLSFLIFTNAAYPGFTPKTETVFFVPPGHILHIGARNNGFIIPPRLNMLYVPARKKLIHDF